MTMYRKIKRVLDGDTFQTYRKVQGSNFVRLVGVNAPEKWQFGRYLSTQSLKRQIEGTIVTLQP